MFLQRRIGIVGVLVTGLFIFTLGAGCGEDEETGLPIDEVAAGWALFATEDYDAAIAKFDGAIGEASGWSEPYSGLGWCYAALDNAVQAEEEFAKAIERNANHTDAWAGKAIVQLVLQKHHDAGVAASRSVKLGGENYVFRYDPTVTANALRIVLAECAYYVGDYTTAEEQVELVDLGTILNPDDPDYEEQLLEAIGRLSRQ